MSRTKLGTGSDRRPRTGGQDVAVVFASRAALILLNIAMQGVLAHLLLPDGRGSYAVCVAFATSLGLLCTPGAEEGAQQFVMTGRERVSQAVSTAAAICLAGSAAGAALALAAMQTDVGLFQKAHAQSFHLSLGVIPLLAFSTAIEHQLLGLRRFGRLAVFLLLRSAVSLAATVLLVRQLGFGVDGALAAFAASHALMIALCLGDLRRHCGLTAAWPRRGSMAFILGYGLKFHLARLRFGLGPHLGIVVLGLWASSAEIGLFAVASALMFGFAVISHSVGHALLPRLAAREAERSAAPRAPGTGATDDAQWMPALVACCLRLVFVVTAAAVLALLLASTPLIRILFSSAFLAAAPLLWLLAPGILANACCGIFVTYFKAVNAPLLCSRSLWLGWCVELAALVALFPVVGIAAAPLSVTLGGVCGLLLLGSAFQSRTALSWRDILLPRRDDAAFLRAAAGAAARAAIGERRASRSRRRRSAP